MINKKDIIKMAKQATSRSQGRPNTKLADPHREWFIGIAFFLAISIVGGVFTARNYVYYDSLEQSIERNPVQITLYHADDVAGAIDTYEKREALFNSHADDYRSKTLTSASNTSTSTATTTATTMVDTTEETPVTETSTTTTNDVPTSEE